MGQPGPARTVSTATHHQGMVGLLDAARAEASRITFESDGSIEARRKKALTDREAEYRRKARAAMAAEGQQGSREGGGRVGGRRARCVERPAFGDRFAFLCGREDFASSNFRQSEIDDHRAGVFARGGEGDRIGAEDGMQDFTMSLKKLVEGELVDRNTAFSVAPNQTGPDHFCRTARKDPLGKGSPPASGYLHRPGNRGCTFAGVLRLQGDGIK